MTERIVPYSAGQWPNLDEYLIFLRHLAAYYFVQPKAAGQRILDLGCGSGYGSAILAGTARQLVALDRSSIALDQARIYPLPDYVAASATNLPFSNEAFDLVISFQVIEHIVQTNSYLREIVRILAPGGTFIVSTPNKTLRLLPFEPPFNPYHVREFSSQSLRKTLAAWFSAVEIFGLQTSPKLLALEQARLRQVNPIRYRRYLEQLAYAVLPIKLQEHVRAMRREIEKARLVQPNNNLTPSKEFSERDYSPGDYWFEKAKVELAIDLIGICRKA